MTIAIVEVKLVYGVPKVYPVNDVALALSALTRTTTLTAHAIRVAKRRLGITFQAQSNGEIMLRRFLGEA
jgi:hypothetical protein